ncbi:ChaN family lipoprotein [Synechocystis sp. PCC 7509]|uniref:ChaN family lipoprotein n=1 Tax=Synechocystis sp. PCC 7509 TaxID=927677 RepID=UPI0002AC334B|nr:ChaN family lipoprotein [Synechocystis sp. PCC 7509]
MKLFTKRLFLLSLFAISAIAIGLIAIPTYSQQIDDCRPQIVLPENFSGAIEFLEDNSKCKNSNQVTSYSEALQQLAKAKVVYLGETHDNVKDHRLQLAIIQQLYKKNSKVAIALEIFQRPYQGVVNDYLAGKINEQELLDKSEYKKRWGYPWQYYAPIVQFAKAKKLPVLALNTPTEITRLVAKNGLDSLTPEQSKLIPPLSEIRTDNAEYRQLMLGIFQQHQADAKGNSESFEKFFQAQVLWDETMAEAIAKFIQSNPGYQVVVLVGQGHIVYNYGIPSRVAPRRLKTPLNQRSVLLSNDLEEKSATKLPIADYVFWQESN